MNPNTDNTSRDWMGGEIIGLEGARVISAPSHSQGDGVGHHVEVEPDTFDEPTVADVRIDQVGDVSIPTEGSRVIIGYRVNARPLVLGSRYSANDTVPEYEPGERIIGHPTSNSYIHLDNDGGVHIVGENGNSVTMQSNGDVVINDGNTQPVTDVSTSTDADGHVTSISLTRASGVYLPSQ